MSVAVLFDCQHFIALLVWRLCPAAGTQHVYRYMHVLGAPAGGTEAQFCWMILLLETQHLYH